MKQHQVLHLLRILVGILAIGNLPFFALGTFFLPAMTPDQNPFPQSFLMLTSYGLGVILFCGYWFYLFYTFIKGTTFEGTTIFWVCHLVYNILAVFVIIWFLVNSEFAPLLIFIVWPALSVCLAIIILWLEQIYEEGFQGKNFFYEKHLEKLKSQERH